MVAHQTGRHGARAPASNMQALEHRTHQRATTCGFRTPASLTNLRKSVPLPQGRPRQRDTPSFSGHACQNTRVPTGRRKLCATSYSTPQAGSTPASTKHAEAKQRGTKKKTGKKSHKKTTTPSFVARLAVCDQRPLQGGFCCALSRAAARACVLVWRCACMLARRATDKHPAASGEQRRMTCFDRCAYRVGGRQRDARLQAPLLRPVPETGRALAWGCALEQRESQSLRNVTDRAVPNNG